MTNLERLQRSEAETKSAAEVSIRIGTRVAFDAKVTSAGLLSVGALVSGILLSTAVIVVAAGARRRKRIGAAPPAL